MSEIDLSRMRELDPNKSYALMFDHRLSREEVEGIRKSWDAIWKEGEPRPKVVIFEEGKVIELQPWQKEMVERYREDPASVPPVVTDAVRLARSNKWRAMLGMLWGRG